MYTDDKKSEITTPQDLRSDSLLNVFHSTLSTQSGMFTEHHHTACEITMVLSGSGIYATKSAEFSFKSGDIFFFSTNEFHWIKKLDSSADFLNVHFEPRYIWSENFGISNAGLIKMLFNRKGSPVNKLDARNQSTKEIGRLIFNIEDELSHELPEYQTMAKLYLVNILVNMLRSYEGKISEQYVSYNSQTLRAIESAIDFIDNNLDSDISLEQLSEIAHLSKTYFCGQFKKLNGISPWEYITIKRIERAISYIESTNLTKLEIAARCGFNNTSNFYHAFKRITGKTPKDYIN